MYSTSKSDSLLPAVLIVATWAVIAGLFVAFAVNVWPAGAQDEQCIIPPALEYRSAGDLVHPFWQKAKAMDPTGEGRLIYHGYLLQLLVRSLAVSPGYPGAHMVVMLILAATLGLFALAVIRVVRIFPEVFAPYRAVLGMLAVAGLATALLGLSGRPEPLAMLVILAGFHAMTRLAPERYWIAGGIALGLFGVTSPLAATVGFFLYSLYVHYRLGRRDAIISVVAAGGLAALVALSITVFWYPYSVTDWIKGLMTHWATTNNPLRDVVHYWFTNPRNSFYGLLFMLALALGAFRLGTHRCRVRSRVGFAISLAALLVIMARAHLYSPGINYNLIAFSPLVYLAVVFTGLEVCRGGPTGKGAGRPCPVLAAVILVVFLMTSLGFVRTLVTFPSFLRRGMSYAEAKAQLEELRSSASGPILITPAIFGLFDDYDGIGVLEMPDRPVPETYEFVVFSQVGLARQTPPRIEGYVLVEDRFDHEAPRLFGVKVANSNHGYAYAVYRRDARQAVPGHETSH